VGDLSPHFDRSEFRDKRTGELPAGAPSRALIDVLERLRSRVGRPLRIVSGYRSPATNKAVGGAPRSRHLYGDAADIPSGYATTAEAAAAGAVGIGSRGRWAIHVDTRPGPPARWRYPA
jgi:zinc D-Ala-D-Ala carboxypeptidase